MENGLLKKDSEIEDKILIDEAIRGSKKSLEKLIHNHYKFIYNLALRFVLNPDDAEDLTQEVIIKVITKLGQFKQESQFRTWLYRIVFNHFLTMQKRKMENVVTSFDEYANGLDAIPFQELSKTEEIDLRAQVEDAKIGCMNGMLLCLSREQRLIFVIGEIFEVDSVQASRLLDITADNFRKILSRARKDLYNFMNNKCGLINTDNPCRCPKKTKGFIEAGWVNAENLQFNTFFTKRISAFALEKSNQCDNLMEEKYSVLFKDHPYYDKDNSYKIIQELANNTELKSIFNLLDSEK